ncbi:MAG: hypothetical protein COB89_03335 [Piscirickettsiaceae bacterium]|nr:MAG: hypothetical protein COB89_03335 [Piscirickettsiaceae bacterium]
MTLPTEHPLRYRLFNESHARPYAELSVPVQVSYLVLLTGEVTPQQECAHLRVLAERYAVAPPLDSTTHFDADFGRFSIKWERHTEFSSYSFFANKQCSKPFSCKVIDEVPDDWLAAISGELLVAQHIEILSASERKLDQPALSALFQEDSLVGSFVGGTSAEAWTDFRLQKDGFSQVLVLNNSLTAQTTSRLIQHLLELEAYRMLALLGLPLVEKYGKTITDMGQKLTDLTRRMSNAQTLEEERSLLEDLTSLEADIEMIIAATSYRFSASQAYKSIVEDRLVRLRENRIEGRQMLSRYLERRFQPAMNACESLSTRLETLSSHVARATQILMARVNLALESQNRDVLNSMDRRAKVQLRLQETVEGLSIAAISYYVVGLVSYISKALKALGLPIKHDLFVGASIPIVLICVWVAVHSIKKRLLSKQASSE